ncbi:MAG: lipase family protein [Spirosomataceae bacterium]
MNQPDGKSKAIFLFSQLSNINFGVYCANPQGLKDNLNNVTKIIEGKIEGFQKNVILQKIKSFWDREWQIVWGPCMKESITKKSKQYPETVGTYHANNAMYVIKGGDAYVVGVAATNMLSTFEQEVEDLDVFLQEPWNILNPNHGHISQGAKIGVEVLMDELKDSHGRTLLQFLEETIRYNEPAEIITCGHSLGGALCPLVALKIAERKHFLATWRNVSISSYPTAAPVIGDSSFNNYVSDLSKSDKIYINSMYNFNDIVPMAWQANTFGQIPDAYIGFGVVPNTELKNTLNFLVAELKKVNHPYYRMYDIKECTFKAFPLEPTPQGDSAFMTEAMYQHISVYYSEGFGFDSDFISHYNQFIQAILPRDCKTVIHH